MSPQKHSAKPLENLREEKESVEMLSEGRDDQPPPPPPPPLPLPLPGGSDGPHDPPPTPLQPAQPKDPNSGEEGAPFELKFIDDEASSVEASLVSPAPLTRPEDEFYFDDGDVDDDDSVGGQEVIVAGEDSADGSSTDALSPGSTIKSTETSKEFIIHSPD